MGEALQPTYRFVCFFQRNRELRDEGSLRLRPTRRAVVRGGGRGGILELNQQPDPQHIRRGAMAERDDPVGKAIDPCSKFEGCHALPGATAMPGPQRGGSVAQSVECRTVEPPRGSSRLQKLRTSLGRQSAIVDSVLPCRNAQCPNRPMPQSPNAPIAHAPIAHAPIAHAPIAHAPIAHASIAQCANAPITNAPIDQLTNRQ